MFHVPLAKQQKSDVDYARVMRDKEASERLATKQTPNVPDDDSLPDAPPGFAFYRIQNGDTLVSLSVKFNISQNRLKRYNREICFGHRLTHIIGKLILVPTTSDAKITPDIQEQLEQLIIQDESKSNLEDRKYEEPDENGKYQLRKALIFHAKIDEHRANFYLGEANWNVRKALNLYREDDKWDKEQRVIKACNNITNEEAKQLLSMYGGDASAAIQHYHKKQKQINKQNEKMIKQLNKNKNKNKNLKLNKKNKEYRETLNDENEIELQENENNNNGNDRKPAVDADYNEFSRPCC